MKKGFVKLFGASKRFSEDSVLPTSPSTDGGRGNSGRRSNAFHKINDQYATLDAVQTALRSQGLESSSLVIAVDFTKSNEWSGRKSFASRSLHHISPTVRNPYQQAISAIVRTLDSFDDDKLIPCYGFGDSTTNDRAVFSFFPNDQPAAGLEEVLVRYRQVAEGVRLAGPTSFAPAIYQAMRHVVASGMQYHILLLLADGQVTQQGPTVEAIVRASSLPLSIIMIGIGDGPWDTMQEFDDALPTRAFDNFQFVNFTELQELAACMTPEKGEALFALKSLMEIPEQYMHIRNLNLLGAVPPIAPGAFPLPLPPPPTVLEADERRAAVQQLVAAGIVGRSHQPPASAASHQPPASSASHQPPASSASLSPAASSHPRPAAIDELQPQPAPPVAELGALSLRHAGAQAHGGGSGGASCASSAAAASTPSMTAASSFLAPAGGGSASLQPAESALGPASVENMFCCPITQELMDEPVIASDGYTYEKYAIEAWFTNHNTSPMTNADLTSTALIPNHGLRSAIMEYKERTASGNSNDAGGEGDRPFL